MPLFGPPNIEKMEANRDINGLTRILSYKQDSLKEKHTKVRLAAAKALGNLKDPQAVKSLIAALADKEKEVRIAVVKALAHIEDARAVEPLIHSLDLDDDSGVRITAAKALGIFGEPHDGETLLRSAFDAKSDDMRKMAWDALYKLDVHSATNEDKAWYWVFREEWEKCVSLGEPAINPLISALKDKNINKRAPAASALGKIGDQRSVAPLVSMLKDEYSYFRLEAAKALENLGWKPATREEEAWYWISRRQWDECSLHGEPAIDPLIIVAVMANGRARDDEVYNAAVNTLSQIGASAVKTLITGLRDKNRLLRNVSADALGKIGDHRAIKPLYNSLKDHGIYWQAAVALVNIGDDHIIDVLIQALDDKNWLVRWESIHAIGKIGDARCVVGLIEALSSGLWEERMEAIRALGMIGDERAVEALIPFLNFLRSHTETAKSLLSLYKSGKLGDHGKQAILAQRDLMMSTLHGDQFRDINESRPACQGVYVHDDEGKFPGIDFPL